MSKDAKGHGSDKHGEAIRKAGYTLTKVPARGNQSGGYTASRRPSQTGGASVMKFASTTEALAKKMGLGGGSKRK
jgi:hypothetical protein